LGSDEIPQWPASSGWGVTDPKTIPHTCYRVKFGTFATKGVRINRKEPPKLRNAGACPIAAGAWMTP